MGNVKIMPDIGDLFQVATLFQAESSVFGFVKGGVCGDV
jgi:hypothetical protein